MDKTGRVGVVGAGTMGAGIAQGAARAGYKVLILDRQPGAAERAVERARLSWTRAAEAGRLSENDARMASERLRAASALSDLSGCGLIVEAIVEDEDAKGALFRDLSAALPRETIIATNTSTLRIGELAGRIANPERFIGLHYFFPAAVNPLIEIIPGAATGSAARDAATAFAQRTGKTPIVCRDVFGFAINRFFVPYLNEAVRLVDEGVPAGVVESVAREVFGTPAGPFRVMDLTKPVIACHAAGTLARLHPFYAPAPGLVAKAAEGGLWSVEDRAAGAQATVVSHRLRAAVFFAVLDALDQEVASPADIDLGATIGLHWTMQPWQTMVSLGRDAVARLLAPLIEIHRLSLPKSLGLLPA
ncbi:3-hydroxyacyl-CoA dehydrogenase family protein [Azospirillum sp. sgz301742]